MERVAPDYWKYNLRSSVLTISDAVDFDYIYPTLKSSQKFDNYILEDILNSTGTREKKISRLLNIVISSDYELYLAFRDAIKKDYEWVYEELNSKIDVTPEKIDEVLERSLREGGVPQLPHNYIKRKDQEMDIRILLRNLKPKDRLVVSGMVGSGKSSLVSSVLRNDAPLVIDCFNEKVFWINSADCISPENIKNLKSRISGSLRHVSRENDEDFSALFSDPLLKQALIIVDNLHTLDALKPFLLDCKVLITTQHNSILNDCKTYNVPNALTPDESLELFALSLKRDVQSLPRCALEIHENYKGHPLLIALMGTILADHADLLKDAKDWKKNIPTLENVFALWVSGDKYAPIQMTIDAMQENIREKYMMLAVLQDGAKVTTAALAVILNTTENHVRQMTKDFLARNLLIEHYNIPLNAFEYEVHTLVSEYLKKKLKENGELQNMHATVLERYRKTCLSGDLIHLPDDGYICYYICHHMEAAGESMKSLLTNLTYIGNKVRLAGYPDFFSDMKKYGTEEIRETELFECLEDFLRLSGSDLNKYQFINFIQHIIQHSQPSVLYNNAMELAQKEYPTNLYLEFPYDNKKYFVENIIKEEISAMRTFNFPNSILIGTANGVITHYDADFQKMKVFKNNHGHKKPISFIAVSNVKPYLMATAKVDSPDLYIWHVIDDDRGFGKVSKTERRYGCEIITSKNGPYFCAIWAHHSNLLITNAGNISNNASTLFLYSVEANLKYSIRGNIAEEWITAVALSPDDSLVFAGTTNAKKGPLVKAYNLHTREWVLTINQELPAISLFLVPDQLKAVYVLTEKCLLKHMWDDVMTYETSQSVFTTDSDTCAISDACLAADNSLLFISTSTLKKFLILTYHFKTSKIIAKWNNERGAVKYMDACIETDKSFHLVFSATSNSPNTVKLWLMPGVFDESPPKSDRMFELKFDSIFNEDISNNWAKFSSSSSDSTPSLESPERHVEKTCEGFLRHRHSPNKIKQDRVLTVAISTSNRIHVFCGKTLLAESLTEKVTITSVALSNCGSYIIYGLRNGQVKRFHRNDKQCIDLMTLKGPVDFLKTVNGKTIAAAGNYSLAVCSTSPLVDHFVRNLPENGRESSSNAETSAVVECFFFENAGVLSVSCDGFIKQWTENSDTCISLENTNSTVVCASLQNSMLAICNTSQEFQLYNVRVSDATLSLERLCKDTVTDNMDITSCCISGDCKMLAIGTKQGDIVLWDTLNKYELYNISSLDQSPISQLMFSPVPPSQENGEKSDTTSREGAPLVLVAFSAGVQWWDVSEIQSTIARDNAKRKSGNIRLLTSQSLQKINASKDSSYTEEQITPSLIRWRQVWNGKRCRSDTTRKHLLAYIKLRGTEVSTARIADDFTTFVTIDDPGHFYIMNVIDVNAPVVQSMDNISCDPTFTVETAKLCENDDLA